MEKHAASGKQATGIITASAPTGTSTPSHCGKLSTMTTSASVTVRCIAN